MIHQVILGQGKYIIFSGLGDANHNGLSKKSINTAVYMALTKPINAAMNRNEYTMPPELWPMAMDYA